MKPINLRKAVQDYEEYLYYIKRMNECRHDTYENEQEFSRRWMVANNFYKDNLESVLCKINRAIKKEQGRVYARIMGADELLKAIAKLDEKLHCTKSSMEGLKVTVNVHSEMFLGSVPHVYMGTLAQIEYKKGWRLVAIWRGKCDSTRYRLDIPEAMKESIIDYYTHKLR